jgi:hypothetical protein
MPKSLQELEKERKRRKRILYRYASSPLSFRTPK